VSLVFILVAVMLVLTGCGEVTEAEVIGVYTKNSEEAVKLIGGNTEVTLDGTQGKVSLELKEGGEAYLEGWGDMPWSLKDGKVTISFTNASSSGEFKGDKIVGLGGEGVVWNRK
jgi:hypothetical protein